MATPLESHMEEDEEQEPHMEEEEEQEPHMEEEERVKNLVNIVVAVDQSKESMHACKWACKYILSANNRQSYNFTLLHVRPHVSVSSGPAFIFSGEVLHLLKCDEARTAQKISKRALDICNRYNVKAKTHVVTGEPKEKICEAAHKLGAHFLVMGSHDHGPFIRAIKGSVSDYCCRNAICPVVVVNKKVLSE